MRNDFLEQRFQCCEHINSVRSFVSPLERVQGVSSKNNISGVEVAQLSHIMSHAIGAVTLKETSTFAQLNKETEYRLSFLQCISPKPISRYRLAWIQGREDYECLEQVLTAASGLGISLVVMDEPGHWLQSKASPWSHLREEFVELDISPDEGLHNRIVEAVQEYPKHIDGIVTISDVRLPAIARACMILGLPTQPASAYDLAGDKGKTRLLEESSRDVLESFVLPSASNLETELVQRKSMGLLNFPLIVKPVIGWSSDCVAKVTSENELQQAVNKASSRHAQSPKKNTAVIIEPYISGPEVDVNFIMINGKILFVDINDDFPSPGDEVGATFHANFQETQNVFPSALPEREKKELEIHLRETVLRMGFDTGVFHCEARVRNSDVQYGQISDRYGGGSTLIDLQPVPTKDSAKQKPEIDNIEVYVHEVNSRPPGDLESAAIMLTYGVDFYAVRMLLALGDNYGALERARALSLPFLDCKPQFHLSLMIIHQKKRGIMRSVDAAREFLEREPEAKNWVVDYYSRKKAGDTLEGPNAPSLWWLAFFSVVSRTSRRELLERVAYVEKEFDYQMDEENE